MTLYHHISLTFFLENIGKVEIVGKVESWSPMNDFAHSIPWEDGTRKNFPFHTHKERNSET